MDPEYDGYLIFNRISSIRGEPDFSRLEQILKSNPRDGDWPDERIKTKQILLPDRAVDEPIPRELLRIYDDNIRWYKYTIEKPREVKGYDEEGNLNTYYEIDETECDIFFIEDRFIAFRGSKPDVEEVSGRVYNRLQEVGQDLFFEDIEFGPDFLLWLFSRYHDGKPIPGDLEIQSLTDAKVEGGSDQIGQSNTVSGSVDVTRSAPVLLGILNQKRLSMIGGDFFINGVSMDVEIASPGKIHVKASNDIQNLNSSGRVITSLSLIREICSLWEYWLDLDPRDKYPASSFFKEFYKSLNRSGVEVSVDIDPVVREYKQKRGE